MGAAGLIRGGRLGLAGFLRVLKPGDETPGQATPHSLKTTEALRLKELQVLKEWTVTWTVVGHPRPGTGPRAPPGRAAPPGQERRSPLGSEELQDPPWL